MKKVVAFSVCEGDHFTGVGALANSLYRHGYRGVVWVGYRGSLPSWVKGDLHEAASDFAMRFVPLPDDRPVPFSKPTLGLRILEELEPDADGIFYFDSDVLLCTPWQFFAHWAAESVACVTDFWSPRIPPGHPWRQAWTEIAAAMGERVRDLVPYHQNAMFGLPRAHADVLKIWQRAIDFVRTSDRYGGLSFQTRSRNDWPHLRGDQDFFAIALMASSSPIADITGEHGFGYTGFGSVALHPIGAKPWRSGAWRRIVHGQPPEMYERVFWDSLRSPIEVIPARRQRWGLLRCRVGRLVGRVYRAPA